MANTIEQAIKERFNLNYVRTATYNLETFQEDKAVATSYLGTPIFSNLELEAVQYRDFDDNVHQFDGFTLDVCLMTANMQNNIIETQIQGRNGSVKEMISTGDYRVTVNGFLISQNSNVAPYILMGRAKKAGEVTTSIKVNSAFLNALDIYEIVVNDVSFGEIEATRNMIAITLNLTSEIPIEIRLA